MVFDPFLLPAYGWNMLWRVHDGQWVVAGLLLPPHAQRVWRRYLPPGHSIEVPGDRFLSVSPNQWLAWYGKLRDDVDFYFPTEDGTLERLG